MGTNVERNESGVAFHRSSSIEMLQRRPANNKRRLGGCSMGEFNHVIVYWR